jgi:SlyX protein
MSEKRIVELEIKFAYQEDLLQDLNSIVADQQRQIDRLELICKQLTEHVRNLQLTQSHSKEADELPPHY